MGFGDILGNLVDAVTGRNNDENNQQNVDNQYADQGQYVNQGGEQDILPASMDPLGDPADDPQYAGNFNNEGGDILPASQDPLGDPADDPSYR